MLWSTVQRGFTSEAGGGTIARLKTKSIPPAAMIDPPTASLAPSPPPQPRLAFPPPRGRICARCVYDEHTPGISFDADGICNYCHLHDAMESQYPTGAEGEGILKGMV